MPVQCPNSMVNIEINHLGIFNIFYNNIDLKGSVESRYQKSYKHKIKMFYDSHLDKNEE